MFWKGHCVTSEFGLISLEYFCRHRKMLEMKDKLGREGDQFHHPSFLISYQQLSFLKYE